MVIIIGVGGMIGKNLFRFFKGRYEGVYGTTHYKERDSRYGEPYRENIFCSILIDMGRKHSAEIVHRYMPQKAMRRLKVKCKTSASNGSRK